MSLFSNPPMCVWLVPVHRERHRSPPRIKEQLDHDISQMLQSLSWWEWKEESAAETCCDFLPPPPPATFKPGCWDGPIFKELGMKTSRPKYQTCPLCYLYLLWNHASLKTLFTRRLPWLGKFPQGDDRCSPVKNEMGNWKVGLKLNNTVQNFQFRVSTQ